MQHVTDVPLSVAAVQINSQQDIKRNLETIAHAVQAASQQGAQLVVLPENCCSMGAQAATAEQFDTLSNTLAQLAARHHVHLLAGTLPCAYRPDGTPVPDKRLRQVSQLFAPDGSQVARYDKIHLFQATVADDTGSYNEAATFEAGTQTVVAPIRLDEATYHLGMMVCFDLRFPALAQRLRQAGSDILSAPSAFTYLTGQAHWSLLLQARALDSQCMVIGAAQGGTHQYPNRAARKTWGHGTITRHDGTIAGEYAHSALADKEAEQGYRLIMADFDKGAQTKGRESLPIFNCHRLA